MVTLRMLLVLLVLPVLLVPHCHVVNNWSSASISLKYQGIVN